MKDFWIGRMLLITWSLSKQNILAIFKTNTYTFKNILQTWKHFQKIKHFVRYLESVGVCFENSKDVLILEKWASN